MLHVCYYSSLSHQRANCSDSKSGMSNDHCAACRYRQSGAVTDGSRSDRRFAVDGRRSGRVDMRFRLITFLLVLFISALLPASEACFPGGRLIRRLPKSEPPLVYKQHVPNVPENSLAASGPREGRIRQFNKRFKELVVNYNPDILFKDEEGTGEDRIMSVRCKEKLDALAMLVINFWPGVKLRVTEAWDQDGFHAPDSLHYEGRAVDITTSDRDRNKYGLLARLAAQAGFDWVYYENRMHVHASVKSDAVTRHKRVFKCFPGHATVLTETGVRIAMRDLLVGDRVAVLPANGRLPVYEPVVAFLHRNTSAVAPFVEVHTSTGRVFTASSEHLVYVSSGRNGSDVRSISTKPMGRVELGDKVLLSDAEPTGPLRSEMVTTVRLVIGRGLYAPLTESGTVFVDDVLASCYAAVRNEHLAHHAVAPLRLWHRLISFLRPSASKRPLASGSETDGIHWYAELLLRAAECLERWGLGKIIDDV